MTSIAFCRMHAFTRASYDMYGRTLRFRTPLLARRVMCRMYTNVRSGSEA